MRKSIIAIIGITFMLPNARAADIQKDIERGIGRVVADEIESTYGVVDDPLLTGWVNRVGQKLASVSGRTDVKYQFKVLDSDDVNAVAAPGGFIYVNRGTLRFIKSEDELAAVMGHEVGHVAGKHSMKQINAQLLGSIVLAGFSAIHANTLKTVGGIAGGLAMLKFGRDEENDADRRGLKNAIATGYDGGAMLDFFRHLQATEKDKPTAFEVYFLTHPPTAERIKRIAKEPGTAHTTANTIALAAGRASRSLFREAAESYRKAIEMDPDNADLKVRLSECLRQSPRYAPPIRMSPPAKAESLAQLDTLSQEISEVERRAYEDRRGLSDAQKNTDTDLEAAAQSLSSASQYIYRRDSPQYRELVRMARSFDRAVRVGANLRAARDLSDETLSDVSRLVRRIRENIEAGDGASADQARSMLSVGHSLLIDLAEGLKQAKSRAGDAKDGARTLRNAADSLYASFRTPFGYSSGQFDILGLQVGRAQDSLNDAVGSTRRALGLIARARVHALIARINNATRTVRQDDTAISGIIAHYLGIEAQAVAAMRPRLAFGDATLALADEQIEAANVSKKRASTSEVRTAAFSEKPSIKDKEGRKWENAAVLFNLIVNDIERETAKD